MAKFTRIQVAQKMGDQGMVPLFYHPDIATCKSVLQACYNGGARLLEFTNRGDYAHEVFNALNKFCLESLPGMMLGVGSIADAGTASLYLQMGANFIVSASIREDVAKVCNRRKVLYSPGCGTLTEIGIAEELGCEVVKLFPGSIYGPEFIKAVRAPQPWTNIMPTGGVEPTHENLEAWFKAGAYCVGMGSKLISKEIINSGDFDTLTKKTEEALAMIREIRS